MDLNSGMESSGITTIIPTFFDSGLPIKRFIECVESIEQQTVKPDKILITDDSIDDTKRKLFLSALKIFSIPIFYIKNNNNRGMGSNSNNGLANVNSEFVHILHSDDKLISNKAYRNMLEEINKPGSIWTFSAGIVNNKIESPSLNDLLWMGKNSLGGPSGLFTRIHNYLEYDTNLKMLVDVEQYFRMFKNFGPPSFISDPLIEYGVGSWQVQRNFSQKCVRAEMSYILEKHESLVPRTLSTDVDYDDLQLTLNLELVLRKLRIRKKIQSNLRIFQLFIYKVLFAAKRRAVVFK